jgi:hypothetical protein
MPSKNLLSLAAVLYLVAGVTQAQQKKPVPPPPKPPDDGPSLEATMTFIQSKLSSKTNFVEYIHDDAQNTDRIVQLSVETSKVIADPSSCRIAYHTSTTRDGKITVFDGDGSLNLREVEDLVVRTGEQEKKIIDSDGGHLTDTTRFDPPIFFVVARRSQDENTQDAFLFREEDMANRVAKALVHAVELCGGGSKEPF